MARQRSCKRRFESLVFTTQENPGAEPRAKRFGDFRPRQLFFRWIDCETLASRMIDCYRSLLLHVCVLRIVQFVVLLMTFFPAIVTVARSTASLVLLQRKKKIARELRIVWRYEETHFETGRPWFRVEFTRFGRRILLSIQHCESS